MHKSHKNKRKRGKNGNSYRHGVPAERGGKENSQSSAREKTNPYPQTNSEDGLSEIETEKNVNKTSAKDSFSDLPYEIQYSDIMGRYLVASRDLEPGDLIITADPLVVGPCAGCDIICLGCYQPITSKDIYRCCGCRWPLCGPHCPGLHQTLGHSLLECLTLAEHCKEDVENLMTLKTLYNAIVPLRCLLLKASDPEKWEDINKMVAHNDIRRQKKDLWKHNQTIVVDKIRKTWNLPQYKEDEIHTICGILEVNAFEVGPLGASLRALYPRAYFLAHDCTPNTTHTDDTRRRLTVRAARHIQRGEAITLSYAYTLQSTQKRREHLLETKFFECNCARCSDPKELGSYAGALLCPRCTAKPDCNSQTRSLTEIPKFANCDSTKHKDNARARSSSVGDDLSDSVSNVHIGVVLPLAPLEYGSSWKCETCSNYTLTASVVSALVQKINDEYDSIDPNDVEGFESFLQRYRNVLHPNHFLCLSAKLSLSQLYGKVDSHLIHQMSPSQLQMKKDICQDILKVFDIIEPGYSRLRGITLYELHAPLMVLTTRGYEKREISKPELRTRLREVARCLNESATILGIEPKESSEGIMATAAKDALRQIKDWEKIIGKIL